MLSFRIVLALPFLLASPAFAETPGPNDLVGFWSGDPPKGGSLEIEIRNVDGNGAFTASANVRASGGSSRPIPMTIGDGAVNGEEVRFFTQYRSEGKTRYTCRFAEKDKLECKTKYHRTTFTRVR